MRGALEPWHLVILAVVFMALFGAKRLPDSARALGESLHIFKKTVRGPEDTPTPAEPRTIPGSVEVPRPAAQQPPHQV
jgi:sec-independent protein translocase protein TatA